MMGRSIKYVIVSPVKDEAEHVEITITSVLAQTCRPYRWIIVDDGSRDQTPQILKRYADAHSWIQVLKIERDPTRKLGYAEIQAFACGFELVCNDDFEFIVKLDGDLELPVDYFEKLLKEFHSDRALGIASGIYLENSGTGWRPVTTPPYHAAGASKMVRMACFEDIGGFPLCPGWDTVDEIKAQAKGWRTRHFKEIEFRHLRPEGSASGSLQTNLLHGKVSYVTGVGGLFFFMKCVHRAVFGKPLLVGGLALLWGYLSLLLKGQQRLLGTSEARLYRKILNERLKQVLTGRKERPITT